MSRMNKTEIAVIGLGYVGLPLAIEFSKNFKTHGFDISDQRINELIAGKDRTFEVSEQELIQDSNIKFTSNYKDLKNANFYIITVPTPIDSDNKPDFEPLIESSKTVAKLLKKDDVVIYESTVYPGATEEICIPILEEYSSLTFNSDFFCGYSPERINPGDKEHRLTNIKKITSGSTTEIADRIDSLYKKIIKAGTHKASSIKVAEAAKVIENTQRDVNIALINELALIFNKLNIDTKEVLDAAETKWNFLPFRPGLVGGHCIGVDPYYLTFKAKQVGFDPEMILAGRKINDNMSASIALEVVKLMQLKKINLINSNILIMGITFKENCPDLRNTKVVNLVKKFQGLCGNVDIYDPVADSDLAKKIYGINVQRKLTRGPYDAIVLAVAHDIFSSITIEKLKSYCKKIHIIYDIKYLFSKDEVDGRL